MSSMPPLTVANVVSKAYVAPLSQRTLKPQLQLFVNGIFVPTVEITITLGAYGVADKVEAKTFFNGLSDAMGGTSIFQMSQKVRPCPVTVKIANHTTGTSPLPVFQGVLDELDAEIDMDTVSINCRGLLAVLIDQRMSLKVDQNVDVGAAISALIKKYGLTPKVGLAGVTVGSVLTADHVAHGRNIRIFDFIRTLANGVGWNVRVQGSSIVVGPVPDRTAVPEFVRTWGSDTSGFTILKITHCALHSHDIKVKVLSYIPKRKGRTASTAQGAVAALLGLPAPLTTAKKSNAGTGKQSSGFTPIGESETIDNEYVVHVVGKTTDQCDKIAANIRDEISTREFVADMSWTPLASDLKALANAGCEFTIRLQGVQEAVMNTTYIPRETIWTWSIDAGLLLSIKGNNIPLPNDEGAAGTL
jgi:hypothetical protein